MDRVRNNDIRDHLGVASIEEKLVQVEVVLSCPKETFRGTSALWSPKSLVHCGVCWNISELPTFPHKLKFLG
jgi:hypothetical protein